MAVQKSKRSKSKNKLKIVIYNKLKYSKKKVYL